MSNLNCFFTANLFTCKLFPQKLFHSNNCSKKLFSRWHKGKTWQKTWSELSWVVTFNSCILIFEKRYLLSIPNLSLFNHCNVKTYSQLGSANVPLPHLWQFKAFMSLYSKKYISVVWKDQNAQRNAISETLERFFCSPPFPLMNPNVERGKAVRFPARDWLRTLVQKLREKSCEKKYLGRKKRVKEKDREKQME